MSDVSMACVQCAAQTICYADANRLLGGPLCFKYVSAADQYKGNMRVLSKDTGV